MAPLLDLPPSEWSSVLRSGPTGSVLELRAALTVLRAQIRLQEGSRARLHRPIRGPRRVRFPERVAGDMTVRVLFTFDGRVGQARTLSTVSLRDLALCHPTRDYSRRAHQLNKPVAFFSRTVGDLVMCESQHERRFAQLADWAPGVVHIAAQPFTLEFPAGADIDSHTPDFVLLDSSGQVLAVDVKRADEARDEGIVRRHQLITATLARAGIRHVVWTGVPESITDNIADFAAARVPDTVLAERAPTLLEAHHDRITRDELVARAVRLGMREREVLVVLRRLLWDRVFAIDLTRRLDGDSQVYLP